MPHPDQIAMMEHLALHSPLSLKAFCARLQSALRLPEFRFDAENETAWGLTVVENVEYNVSRPYKTGTLTLWDSTVPPGCNFGISLIIYRGHPQPNHEWALEHLVLPVARAIAREFDVPVHYHRTWMGVGENVPRKMLFRPSES
jgi:hypothetical protein